jgi:transcription elongation factor Elf1
MSVHIDRTFLLRISPKLVKFKQKKQDLYNFRCPICGDSQKDKNLARGFVFRKKNDYFFYCHNCSTSLTFYQFIDKVEPSLIKEYTLERYKEGNDKSTNYKKPKFDEFKSKPTFNYKEKLKLESIELLSEEHFAKAYCINRQIPEEKFKNLYFTPDFKKFVQDLGIEKKGLHDNDPRLVIPFHDKSGKLTMIQGRSLGESKLRYITVKIDDDSKKLFGIDLVDEEEMIYVVEGPIDSLFLKNAVATADSNLTSVSDVFDKSKFTLVFDNEPRNKDIIRLMEKAIEQHYNIVIWPAMITEKDINEMILAGFTKEELQDIIHSNTFVNLRAKMEFVNWKKI